jgi:hypothetical protein
MMFVAMSVALIASRRFRSAMIVMLRMIVVMMSMTVVVICMCVDDWGLMAGTIERRVARNQPELRCGHAGAKYPIDADVSILDRQAAQRGAKAVERKPEIKQRPEHHVARRTGEAVEVHRPSQSHPPF